MQVVPVHRHFLRDQSNHRKGHQRYDIRHFAHVGHIVTEVKVKGLAQRLDVQPGMALLQQMERTSGIAQQSQAQLDMTRRVRHHISGHHGSKLYSEPRFDLHFQWNSWSYMRHQCRRTAGSHAQKYPKQR